VTVKKCFTCCGMPFNIEVVCLTLSSVSSVNCLLQMIMDYLFCVCMGYSMLVWVHAVEMEFISIIFLTYRESRENTIHYN